MAPAPQLPSALPQRPVQVVLPVPPPPVLPLQVVLPVPPPPGPSHYLRRPALPVCLTSIRGQVSLGPVRPVRLGQLRAKEAKANMAVAVAGLTAGAAVTTGKVRLGGKAAAKASGASKGQGQCGLIADTTVATRSKSKTFHGAHLHCVLHFFVNALPTIWSRGTGGSCATPLTSM